MWAKRIITPSIISIFTLLLFFSCNKKEEEPIETCDSITFNNIHTFKRDLLGYQIVKFIELPSGGYFMSAKIESSLDYKLIKLDASLDVEQEILLEAEKVFDFIVLEDGRCLFASPHDTGDLSILAADFLSIERLPLEYATPPKLTVVDSGVIVASGSGVYSTEVIKYDAAFEQVWRTTFGPSRTYTHYYSAETHRYYIANAVNEIVTINTLDGDIISTISTGRYIQKIVVHDGYIYTTGAEGPVSECKQDVFAVKMNEGGVELWHHTFGSNDSDDWGSNIVVYNNKVYVGGSYAEGCIATAFSGYGNYYLVELTLNGDMERCYREMAFEYSGLSRLFINSSNQLISIGNFSNSEISGWHTVVAQVK